METWTKEQVSGIWRIYHDASIREDNEVCRCFHEADADAIIRDHQLAALARRYREMAAFICDATWRTEHRAHGLSAGDGAALLLDPLNEDYDAIATGSAEEQPS